MSIKKNYQANREKGVSIYLAIMIMSIILSIVLGLTVILIGQIKTTKDIESSVVAFYGADTGIEQMLAEQSDHIGPIQMGMSLGFVEYEVWRATADGSEDWCPASLEYSHCIKSVGVYKETRRAIVTTM